MGLRHRVLLALLCIAKEALQLRMLLRQFVYLLAEGMHAAMPCRMDEVDRPAARQCRLQHGQHWRDADSAADQYQRFVAGNEGEFSRGWVEIDRLTDKHLVM